MAEFSTPNVVSMADAMTRQVTEAMTGLTQAAASAQSAMFGDMTRLFTDMRATTMPDAAPLLAAHRKNMETLAAANRVALEGAQAIARRQVEIMQQTMVELSETLRELAGTDTPQAKAARQTELLKQGYERAVANLRELSDLVQRSNGEAIDLLHTRFAEALDEMKGLVAQAAKS